MLFIATVLNVSLLIELPVH